MNLVAAAIPPTLVSNINMMFLQSMVPKSPQKPSKIIPRPFQIRQIPPKIVSKSISDAPKDFLGTTLDPSSKKVGFWTPKRWSRDAQECLGGVKIEGNFTVGGLGAEQFVNIYGQIL